MTIKIIENNRCKTLSSVASGSVVYPTSGGCMGFGCIVLNDVDSIGNIGIVPLNGFWDIYYEDPDTTVETCEAQLIVTR